MTPEPPPSSEGSSIPPRSRPNLSDLVNDRHETDLWAFDDLEVMEDSPVNPPSRPNLSTPPVPRALPSRVAPVTKAPTRAQDQAAIESVKLDVGKVHAVHTGKSKLELAKPIKDVDELDDWEVAAYEPPTLEIHPSLIGSAASEEEVPEATSQEVREILPLEEADSISSELQEETAATDKVAPARSLVPHLELSKLEKFGLLALLALLLIGGGLIFISVSNRLPTDSGLSKADDFPVKGQHTEILSAKTYWRAPINDGKNADTFRRGTQLLPVVELTSRGNPAAIRLFFRNQDGVVMGDAVTRAILPGVPLEVVATAGFDDLGMHAAYRTGQSKPWTIEVREAPTLTAPNSEFKRLFDVAISTDRH